MHQYYYKIINKSNYSLTIHYSAECYSKIDTTITIEKDSSKIIFVAESHGAEGFAPSASPELFDITELEIINPTFETKKDLLTKKYWKFINVNNDQGMYILTLDSSKLVYKK
jgi:hypothetical protein